MITGGGALRLPPIVVVTGTGTGVGKTVATAALAAGALAEGLSVCVVKPVQTGVPGAPGSTGSTGSADAPELSGATSPPVTGPPDIGEVRRLLGHLSAEDEKQLELVEFVRLPEPLAPQAAARRAGTTLPPVQRHAARIAALAHDHDLILIEGAGGVLVRLDEDGGTVADLAALLPSAQVVIVTEPGLGTLNVTELTVEALNHRNVPILGLIVSRWPTAPGVTELGNLRDLPRLTGVPVLGVIELIEVGLRARPAITQPGGNT